MTSTEGKIDRLHTKREISNRFYFTGKPCKNGHISNRYRCNNECVECRAEKNKELKQKQIDWSAKNKERKLAISKLRYLEQAEKERLRSRTKYAKNPEKVRETNRKWANKNPKFWTEYGAYRRAKLRNRTPKWADLLKIKELYSNCPKGYHVDHIIPLQGKLVSGLHVENNLQYLPAAENLRKFNRFEVV